MLNFVLNIREVLIAMQYISVAYDFWENSHITEARNLYVLTACTYIECRSLGKWYVLVISSVWVAKNCSLRSLVIKKASFCLSQCSAYAQGCCISWLIWLQTALWCQCQVRRNMRWTSALQQWTTLLVSVIHSRKCCVPLFSLIIRCSKKNLGNVCVV